MCSGGDLYQSAPYLSALAMAGGDPNNIKVCINEECRVQECLPRDGDPPSTFRCNKCYDYLVCYTDVLDGTDVANFCEFWCGTARNNGTCPISPSNPFGLACACISVAARIDPPKQPCDTAVHDNGYVNPDQNFSPTTYYCVCVDGSIDEAP
jgi:hypothetical protein